jgi:hypothetical protein
LQEEREVTRRPEGEVSAVRSARQEEQESSGRLSAQVGAAGHGLEELRLWLEWGAEARADYKVLRQELDDSEQEIRRLRGELLRLGVGEGVAADGFRLVDAGVSEEGVAGGSGQQRLGATQTGVEERRADGGDAGGSDPARPRSSGLAVAGQGSMKGALPVHHALTQIVGSGEVDIIMQTVETMRARDEALQRLCEGMQAAGGLWAGIARPIINAALAKRQASDISRVARVELAAALGLGAEWRSSLVERARRAYTASLEGVTLRIEDIHTQLTTLTSLVHVRLGRPVGGLLPGPGRIRPEASGRKLPMRIGDRPAGIG